MTEALTESGLKAAVAAFQATTMKGVKPFEGYDGFDTRCVTDAIRAYLAALLAPVEVGTGWKLVPIEPTEAMKEAGGGAYYADQEPRPFSERAADAYRVMLAASPQNAGGEVGVKLLTAQERIAAHFDVIDFVRSFLATYGNAATDGREWNINSAMRFAEAAILADRASHNAHLREVYRNWQREEIEAIELIEAVGKFIDGASS